MGLCSAWGNRTLVSVPEELRFSPAQIDGALLNASGILYRLTGSRWPGRCRDVVRPNGAGGCGCDRTRAVGCHWLSEVQLPGFPVLAITEVLWDGDLVSESLYRVDDGRWLVYLPESETAQRRGWPCCQRMDLDVTADKTWQVAYEWGGAPEVGGDAAAAALARELLLAEKPGSGCRLPQRVQNVTRQGVSWVLLDDLSMFSRGQTGLPEVDLWLASVTLGNARRRSAIIDPHEVAMRGRRVRRTDWNASS